MGKNLEKGIFLLLRQSCSSGMNVFFVETHNFDRHKADE